MELCEATEENPFVHGMTRSFVNALQQLFNVLDNDQCGTIRYLDLASMWEEDTSDPLLPKGLMACLAKVAMPNGYLTFDRFCAGIKLCLLKNQVEANVENSENSTVPNLSTLTDRPPSEPQMFAPPPPTSVTSNTSIYLNEDINNNSSSGNNNNNNSNTNNSSSSSSSSNNNNSSSSTSNLNSSSSSSIQGPNSTVSQTFLNSNSKSQQTLNTLGTSFNSLPEDASQSKAKKLPLPSYEQVMASKTKGVNVLSPSSSSSIPGDKISSNNSNGLQVKPISHRMPVAPIPLSFYENYSTLSKEKMSHPPPPPLSSIEHYRAKSMSNLDNIAYSQAIPHHQNLQSNPELTTVNNNEINVVAKQTSPKQSASVTNSPPKGQATPRTLSRNCIMKTLQNWRDHIMSNSKVTGDLNELIVKDVPNVMNPNGINAVKGNSAVVNVPNSLNVASLRRNVPKRREPRRHTVGADGVDLYTIRRFQQMEQEKEILHRGLSEIDKTREWFLTQLNNIQEKINFAGRSGMFPSDCNIDAHQERLNFQAARIQYMNQHLTDLREAAYHYPLHMNLAIRPINAAPKPDPNQPRQLVINPNLVNKLKEQNRLLTEEVCQKSDRITQLEREKTALIRELFQARTYSSYNNGEFDDTFM